MLGLVSCCHGCAWGLGCLRQTSHQHPCHQKLLQQCGLGFWSGPLLFLSVPSAAWTPQLVAVKGCQRQQQPPLLCWQLPRPLKPLCFVRHTGGSLPDVRPCHGCCCCRWWSDRRRLPSALSASCCCLHRRPLAPCRHHQGCCLRDLRGTRRQAAPLVPLSACPLLPSAPQT